MENTKIMPNAGSVAYKAGALLLAYLGGLGASLVVGSIFGFVIAWLFILLGFMNTALIVFALIFATLGCAIAARFLTKCGNVFTGIIVALGAVTTNIVMCWVINAQGYTFGTQESIWDNFFIYATLSTILGFIMGSTKNPNNESSKQSK